MRKVIILFIVLFCTAVSLLHAQQQPTGSLSGTIVDTISHNLTRATISLINAKDTTKVKQMLSDEKGKFTFSNVPFDLYMLRVSYLGYEVVNKFVGITQEKPNV